MAQITAQDLKIKRMMLQSTQLTLAPTQEARAEDYAKAEAILAQQVPVVDVYHYVQSRLLKPYVKGFAIHNTQQNYYLKDVYLEKH